MTLPIEALVPLFAGPQQLTWERRMGANQK